MKMIRPTPVTDAVLTTSTIAEDPAAEWASGTPYGLGALVKRTTTHRVYQSLQATNQNHPPETSPTWWVDAGPTNRWAMFDQSVGTLTEGTGTITVTLAPGSVDALGLVDLDAELATVTMTNAGATVYTSTQSTNVGGAAITDWFTYFFEPVGKRTTISFMDLPIYNNATVTVTLTGANPAGPVTVGTLLLGRQFDLGVTGTDGLSAGILDFSKKVTDDFGATTVVPRAFAKRMTAKTMIDTAQAGNIQRELAKVRATPVLWIGEPGHDELTVYGFYKDFSLDLAYSNISYCTLTIEGLT